MAEREDLCNLHLKKFPLSIIEKMLVKLEDNGEIAAQKLFKVLLDKYTVKTSALKS